MNTKQCFSCGAREGMRHFEGRGETMSVKGMERRVDDLSGWECQGCGEVILDPGCSERYSDACDELVIAGRQMIGNEMKRIRRKLHLSQKKKRCCCYPVVDTTRFPVTSAANYSRPRR